MHRGRWGVHNHSSDGQYNHVKSQNWLYANLDDRSNTMFIVFISRIGITVSVERSPRISVTKISIVP